MEYEVCKLGTNTGKNQVFINKKASEGWKLVNIVQVDYEGTSGPAKMLQAYFERVKQSDDKQVIHG